MFIPQVTQALGISASMVFGFLARVTMLNFCSMAVSRASHSCSSSSKYFASHDIAAGFSTRLASTGTVKPLHVDNESCVTLSASFRLESMAASAPARSEEAAAVFDACLGDGDSIRRGASRTVSHAAVNSPGFFTGVRGKHRSFLIVPSIVRVTVMVPALTRFLLLRCTDRRTFSKKLQGCHEVFSIRPPFQSWLFVIFSWMRQRACCHSSDEDFCVCVFFNFVFLSSVEELSESLEESEPEEE